MKHFKLTSNFITNTFGTKLFQLQLNIDCKFGKKGDLGGYVEKVEILQGEDAWLYKDASACGDAIIRGGEIRGGVIWGGEIRGGVIWSGVIRDGVIWSGVIWGGVIWSGVIFGGEIKGGEIRGGEICGGVIRGGEIRGGVIRGGVIWGGVIWSGVIKGGVIWVGVIRAGVIRGGVIFGGEICGGVIWKTPLQFCSGRHYAIVSQPGWLKIGCKQFTFDYWGDNFKKIGEDEGYSEIEIIQYKIIIEMAKKFGDDCFKKIE